MIPIGFFGRSHGGDPPAPAAKILTATQYALESAVYPSILVEAALNRDAHIFSLIDCYQLPDFTDGENFYSLVGGWSNDTHILAIVYVDTPYPAYFVKLYSKSGLATSSFLQRGSMSTDSLSGAIELTSATPTDRFKPLQIMPISNTRIVIFCSKETQSSSYDFPNYKIFIFDIVEGALVDKSLSLSDSVLPDDFTWTQYFTLNSAEINFDSKIIKIVTPIVNFIDSENDFASIVIDCSSADPAVLSVDAGLTPTIISSENFCRVSHGTQYIGSDSGYSAFDGFVIGTLWHIYTYSRFCSFALYDYFDDGYFGVAQTGEPNPEEFNSFQLLEGGYPSLGSFSSDCLSLGGGQTMQEIAQSQAPSGATASLLLEYFPTRYVARVTP